MTAAIIIVVIAMFLGPVVDRKIVEPLMNSIEQPAQPQPTKLTP